MVYIVTLERQTLVQGQQRHGIHCNLGEMNTFAGHQRHSIHCNLREMDTCAGTSETWYTL